MFIWQISTILDNYKQFLPQIYNYKNEIKNNLLNANIIEKIYKEVQSISIDKGILEKSNNIKMIKGNFDWLDIGSMNDYFKIQEKDTNNNVKKGKIIIENVEDCNIYNDDDNIMVAIVGTKDLNIIKSNNVFFIGNKEKMERLPNIIQKIQNDEELEKYL